MSDGETWVDLMLKDPAMAECLSHFKRRIENDPRFAALVKEVDILKSEREKPKAKSFKGKTVRFPEGNEIVYGQDFSFHVGVPSGVDFRITEVNTERCKLVARGYGELAISGQYGNGAIWVNFADIKNLVEQDEKWVEFRTKWLRISPNGMKAQRLHSDGLWIDILESTAAECPEVIAYRKGREVAQAENAELWKQVRALVETIEDMPEVVVELGVWMERVAGRAKAVQL